MKTALFLFACLFVGLTTAFGRFTWTHLVDQEHRLRVAETDIAALEARLPKSETTRVEWRNTGLPGSFLMLATAKDGTTGLCELLLRKDTRR